MLKSQKAVDIRLPAMVQSRTRLRPYRSASLPIEGETMNWQNLRIDQAKKRIRSGCHQS